MEQHPESDTADGEEGEEEEEEVGVIWTPQEILCHGLQMMHYTEKRIKRAKTAGTNVKRFRIHFGCNPAVCAQIWEDLQKTTIDGAQIDEKDLNKDYFLGTFYFLKRYPTEEEREAKFDRSQKTIRTWHWFYIQKIQALKEAKIKWPDDNFGSDIWVMSVDGVHCAVNEPKDDDLPKKPKNYSHKYNAAGKSYELGISLSESKLIWMNGPFDAGESDITIFRNRGLMEKLEQEGKRVIADKGYRGEPEYCSFANSIDDIDVAKFKSRARFRHERFNGMIKTFDCIGKGRFRHPGNRFKGCFEAVCVITQYQTELGMPLFDVYI